MNSWPTLDEAPMAYKSLEDIVDVVAESVDIVEVMKPIFNFKATAYGALLRPLLRS